MIETQFIIELVKAVSLILRRVWAEGNNTNLEFYIPRMRIVHGLAFRDLEMGSNPERGADLYPPALAHLPTSNYLYNFDNVNIILN